MNTTSTDAAVIEAATSPFEKLLADLANLPFIPFDARERIDAALRESFPTIFEDVDATTTTQGAHA